MLNLADKWALVTGASAGLGAEFARQLAARGMHLVLVARRGELLAQLAEELHVRHATRCEVIATDLSQPQSVQQVVAEVERRGIHIDLLVNNAGFGVVGDVDHADIDRLLQMIRLNISAAVELTYRILPGMLARGCGAIINVSSLSAFQPVAFMGVYAASKAFLLHFSEALAEELRPRGITILAVCPGVTRTDFFDIAGAPGWLQKHRAHSPERVVRTALKALEKRRQVIVIGWRNYLLTLLVRLASRRRVVKESTRFFKPRPHPPHPPAG
ncbi:MAG: short-chain dehydrogenase [Planctomycetaceae bacterium]|nr:MAG: short-chain dehydrogenase [Planctomycetaceae bacterium]